MECLYWSQWCVARTHPIIMCMAVETTHLEIKELIWRRTYCWMKRSKCRCTKDQFTNEIWVLSATVLLVSWIFLESSVLLTQVFFKTPFHGIPWGCTHVLCGSPTPTNPHFHNNELLRMALSNIVRPGKPPWKRHVSWIMCWVHSLILPCSLSLTKGQGAERRKTSGTPSNSSSNNTGEFNFVVQALFLVPSSCCHHPCCHLDQWGVLLPWQPHDAIAFQVGPWCRACSGPQATGALPKRSATRQIRMGSTKWVTFGTSNWPQRCLCAPPTVASHWMVESHEHQTWSTYSR